QRHVIATTDLDRADRAVERDRTDILGGGLRIFRIGGLDEAAGQHLAGDVADERRAIRVGTAAHLARLLADTMHTTVESPAFRLERWPDVVTIKSQPTDSVLSTMMHRSDNFFAEQLLLMVSNERFAVMNTKMVIDSLLSNDVSFLPQKPKWVDGSGLSRYNLFTPQDFIAVLQAMKSGFFATKT
ncbi:MAG: D-alanyl-D-alanine carboxypeptidase, partial [Bacteroidetes bacterium]|nr:D-alanyl-D-alanine carboxypeptidase [Bacteroidota bacterium]